ncbi:MAG TPA: NAD(P)/FAD-dependent oxidoreductase [Gemmatimonadales bacterium]|nr:NAD(P)/FAD-dependent oxidoreductase [Gemmatimonadales bacterium]
MSAYDCIVVGGGPAGLSAALVLGRCRRRVLLCDAGRPRNRRARAIHGYLTRDGMPPADFLNSARAELARYPDVEPRTVEVRDAHRIEGGFEVELADSERCRGRTLLIATGVVDEIPALEGIDALYGNSVHHCPYCDGWEHRDQPIAAYGADPATAGLALALTQWSADVVWCSDGPARLDGDARGALASAGVGLREERVVRLEGHDGQLEVICFDRGRPLPRRALFFDAGQHQASVLALKLGAPLDDKGAVATKKGERTGTRGLYVAGDASKDAQLVVVAAAEGAQAAVAINTELNRADLPIGRMEQAAE